MIVAPTDHYYKNLVEAYGHYTTALNSSQLTIISFLDVPNNQDYVSNADFIKVIHHAIEECRKEQRVRPVSVVGTGTGDVVGVVAGVGTERPFCYLCLELQC